MLTGRRAGAGIGEQGGRSSSFFDLGGRLTLVDMPSCTRAPGRR
jgi:hypothetical protein